MKWFMTMLLVLCFAGVGFAAETVNLWKLPAGTYGILDGKIVKGKVLDIDSIPDDPTPPPPPPTPDDLTDTAKKIKAAAEAVTGDAARAETAQMVAAVLIEIAKQSGEGEQLKTIAKLSTAMVLSRRGVSSPWASVAALITATLDAGSGDSVQVKAVLNEIAAGLQASAPGEYQIDIATIMMIIELVMKILEMFKESPALTLDAMTTLQSMLQEVYNTPASVLVPQVAP